MHKILSSIWYINSIITKYSFGILAICLNNKKYNIFVYKPTGLC